MKQSVISAALRERIIQRVATPDGQISGTIDFDAAFPGFAGHFENLPLVPGICLIQAVLELAGTSEHPVQLKSLRQSKFLRMVQIGDRLELQLTCRKTDDGLLQIKGSGSVRGETVLKITLTGEEI